MLLALDDTDGPSGGCTTHALLEVLAAVAAEGWAPRTMPRLVRLNPNVPWKTRGNAAVCVDLAPAAGPSVVIGSLRGQTLEAHPEAPSTPADAAIVDLAWQALQPHVQPDATPTLAAFDTPPPAAWYWAAVQTVVDPEEAGQALAQEGAVVRGDPARSRVGALAAAAWPGPPSSHEWIAYRTPERRGTPRAVGTIDWAAADASGTTFHSWDADEGRPACVPNSPCPVLVGLRGHDPERLMDAAQQVAGHLGEPLEGWSLWATNQASGDHVVPVRGLLDAPELATVQVAATVTALPETRQGGHVFVPMEDATGIAFQAAAFEPTKGFRDVVRALRPGDRVEGVGAYADGVVRLESLRVTALVESVRKVANPVCACGDRMKSRGADAGFRCPTCGSVAAESAAGVELEERTLEVRAYEVPVMARRHLHRPQEYAKGAKRPGPKGTEADPG